MIPLILAAIGGYLIAGCFKNDATKFGDGGVLKLYKGDNKKYYWIFTFENGKIEKSFDGFNTSADAKKDFQYKSNYFKMADGGMMKINDNDKRYSSYYGHTIMSVKNGGVYVNKIKNEIDGTPAKKQDWTQEFQNTKEAENYINNLYNY